MQRKIIKYTCVEMPLELDNYNLYFQSLIDGGWQPFGSPLIAGDFLLQAMVRYEEEN